MKLKKFILGTTAVALTAAVSVGATLAYLTDTDEDVNVMTLGNVYIDQIEQERVDQDVNQNTLIDFEQNKPLLPAVYEKDSGVDWAPADQWVVPGDEAWRVVEDNSNVVDKFVTVKNTGESDAYVRTIFAFEEDASDMIHIVHNGTAIKDAPTWVWDFGVGNVEIDGKTYHLFVATYTGILKPGETTIPSLKQVYLDKAATNEVCAAFGETYEILVYSQAIQVAGFNTTDNQGNNAKTALNEGFGAVTPDNNPWVAVDNG